MGTPLWSTAPSQFPNIQLESVYRRLLEIFEYLESPVSCFPPKKMALFVAGDGICFYAMPLGLLSLVSGHEINQIASQIH